MKVDIAVIRNERERRAWSQEQLASVAGLGLRTVQRIEATGSASYESAAAIAAVLELPITTLRVPVPALAPVTSQPTRWLTGRRVLRLVGSLLLTAVLTPPRLEVALPTAFALWLGVELVLMTRRGAAQQ